jgi:hypothetical protein
MPSKLLQKIFHECVPQELKHKYFRHGVAEEIQAFYLENIPNSLDHEKLKTFNNELKIQALILANFAPQFLTADEILDFAYALDIKKSHLRAVLPYLQKSEMIIECLEKSPKVLALIKTYPNDYFSYFLQHEQTELMAYFAQNHIDILTQWIEQNHEQVLDFCFATKNKDWIDILLPLIESDIFTEYADAHGDFLMEKLHEMPFRYLLMSIKDQYPEWLKDFLWADQFNYFNHLIQNGSIFLFQELFVFLEDILQDSYPNMNLLKVFLYSKNFRAIHTAAQYGQEGFFDWVMLEHRAQLLKILELSHGLVLKILVAYKHNYLFKLLLPLSNLQPGWTSHVQDFEGVYDGNILNVALRFGNLELLDEIYGLLRLQQEPEQIFFNHQDDLFLSAVEGHQVECLEWLGNKLESEITRPDVLEEIVRVNNHSVIYEAALNGDRALLDWFSQRLEDDMIRESYPLFRDFFKSEDDIEKKLSLPILEWLEMVFNERLVNLLKGEYYLSLLQAIKCGMNESAIWILRHLHEKIPNFPKRTQESVLQVALLAENQTFLDLISKQLKTKAIKKLIQVLDEDFLSPFLMKSPAKSLEWLSQYQFNPTVSAAPIASPKIRWCTEQLRNLSLANLKTLNIKNLKKLAQYDDARVFEVCVHKGQLKCLEYFSQKLPRQFVEIISTEGSHLFKQSLIHQEFSITDFLLRQFKKLDMPLDFDIIDLMSEIFRNENISALMWVLETGLLKIEDLSDNTFKNLIEQLCMADSLMVYECIHDAIQVRLQQNLPATFAMLDEDSEVGETILHRLILDINIFEAYETYLYSPMRRHSEKINGLVDDVRLSLEDLIAHQCPDEQLPRAFRLVQFSISHTRCAPQVLNILQVESFRNYAHEQDNLLLRLALKMDEELMIERLLSIPEVKLLAEQNQFYRQEQRIDIGSESSMKNLSFFEEQELKELAEHYHPMISIIGSISLFDALKLKLAQEYEKNPARIRYKRREITLPLTYENFEDLNLPGTVQTIALQAYYQHQVHTALRFLSQPNYWIHPDMDEDLIEFDSNGEASAAISPFIPEIALLYFAAIDEEMQPTEDFTFESRWQNFYIQLALAGRSHNCEEEVEIEREDGTTYTAEQDDLEADKPTCARGIRRHLYQSLLGHPLFSLLTPDLVKQELNAYVFQYYQTIIDEELAVPIKQAFDDYIVELDEDAFQFLKRLDVPQEIQQQFIDSMRSKFKSKFTAEYEKLVSDMFKVRESDAHAINFHQKCLQPVLDRLMHKRKTEDEQDSPNKRACAR